jgi:hypothetical protein
MSQVAKMLGVELGEKFEINENDNWICSFTEKQFEVSNKNKTYVNANLGEHVLGCMLGGTYTVKRKPWKPELGDGYYFISDDGLVDFDTWSNYYYDIILYKLGNCYKTKEEAEKDKDKWIAFYESDEVLETFYETSI